MSLPTDSTHLSSQPSSEMIEEFSGLVEAQFIKDSIMRNYFPVRRITSGDTLINRRIGKTKLGKITAGVRPDAHPVMHGRASVTVDTIVYARSNQDLLNDFQVDFNLRSEIAMDHGKELGRFFDEAFLIQAIKGAQLAAPTDVDSIGGGKNTQFTSAGDDLDPDKLYAAIVEQLVKKQEEDIDTKDSKVFVRPTHYEVLLNNNKLVDSDYSSSNADFAAAKVKYIFGSPIVPTARIPNAAVSNHILSNSSNGNAYDVTATDAKAVAVIMHPRALLVGETIPMTNEIYYDQKEKQWFIDDFMAFGVSVNRPDLLGAVFKA